MKREKKKNWKRKKEEKLKKMKVESFVLILKKRLGPVIISARGKLFTTVFLCQSRPFAWFCFVVLCYPRAANDFGVCWYWLLFTLHKKQHCNIIDALS